MNGWTESLFSNLLLTTKTADKKLNTESLNWKIGNPVYFSNGCSSVKVGIDRVFGKRWNEYSCSRFVNCSFACFYPWAHWRHKEAFVPDFMGDNCRVIRTIVCPIFRKWRLYIKWNKTEKDLDIFRFTGLRRRKGMLARKWASPLIFRIPFSLCIFWKQWWFEMVIIRENKS